MKRPNVPQLWTPSQQKAVLVFCVLCIVFIFLTTWLQPVMVSDPPPMNFPRSTEILDRLDPNVADAAQLAAIPNVGPKKAQEIVDYREKVQRAHPSLIPFRSANDLLRLPGFGPATVAGLSPYLVFDETTGVESASQK